MEETLANFLTKYLSRFPNYHNYMESDIWKRRKNRIDDKAENKVNN